jgi:hypothetical protein
MLLENAFDGPEETNLKLLLNEPFFVQSYAKMVKKLRNSGLTSNEISARTFKRMVKHSPQYTLSLLRKQKQASNPSQTYDYQMFDPCDSKLTKAIVQSVKGQDLNEEQARTIVMMRNHIEVINKERDLFKEELASPGELHFYE